MNTIYVLNKGFNYTYGWMYSVVHMDIEPDVLERFSQEFEKVERTSDWQTISLTLANLPVITYVYVQDFNPLLSYGTNNDPKNFTHSPLQFGRKE